MMKKRMFIILVVLTILAPQACAQRKVVSDYNYRKAVEAYFQDDDDDKALELLNKQIDDTPNHIDSRFIRARIYWSTNKYDAALRDISYAIKHYKGKPSVYKSTLWGLQGAIYDDMERYPEAAESYKQAVKLARKEIDRLKDQVADRFISAALQERDDAEEVDDEQQE